MKIIITILVSSFIFASQIEVINPFIREVPPSAAMSAAFMIIKNNSNMNLKIVSVSSKIANATELHNHVMDKNVMMMRQVKYIDLNAKSKATLMPGSFHIMFIGLKVKLKEGQSHVVNLKLSDGQILKINAPVKKIVTKLHM